MALAMAATLLSFAPPEQAQAQLYIDIFPSQDNPTSETLWVFSGSSSANQSGSIRTSSLSNTYDVSDSWRTAINNFFDANKPNNVNVSLSPLFASSNTDDIESVRVRTAGVWGAGSPFANNATNTPTITIGSGNRTISHLFFDENAGNPDEIGIRVSGSSLSYSTGNASAWTGAGILAKPIGDFFAGGNFNNHANSLLSGNFAATGSGSIQIRVNSQVIPEPEEYALIFGLFALAFVFFHRHFQKKRRQQSAPTS